MDTKIELTNFRDLGGIPAADGKTVAPKRLLRSAEPSGLSASDKKALLDVYNLKNIVDLRTAHEQKEQPDDELPGVGNVLIDIMKEEEDRVPDPDNFLSKLKTPDDTESFMADVYKLMVKDPIAQHGFRQTIDIFLAQKEGSVLYHCTTGKDRTGLASAIILTILGASKHDIMADYLKTNEMRKSHNDEVLHQLKEKGVGPDQLEAIALALEVEKGYLEKSYATAEKMFGSFDDYISDGLGVTPAMQNELKTMYLV